MSYKLYAENIELKPRETKVVKFPWGYFKRTPVINLSSTTNVIMSVQESTKNYFVVTNPTSKRIIVGYSATLKRDQKVIRIYSDIDGDNIPDYLDPDIDGDSFSNEDEIAAGTDPYDASDIPGPTPSSLYIGLATPLQTSSEPLFSFYFGEMNDLIYPTLTNLQPDSNGNTQYEIISDPSSDNDALEPQRVRNINQSIYNNTTPTSATLRIDNLEKNKVYKIFTLASYNEFNPPKISATFKASSSSNEDSHSFLGNVDLSSYNDLINFTDTNVFEKQFWIHNVSIDNSNQVTFTTGSQQEATLADTAMSFMLIHSRYTSNSNGSSPNIEIAIQQASYDGSNDGSSDFAGYLDSYDFDQDNGNQPLTSTTSNNYTAIQTNLTSDDNLENHARAVANMISPRERYRMHVKLQNGTDSSFNISLNVLSMMNYSDLATYNNSYDSSSNLNYHSIIPNDGRTDERTYYHYFTIREDGFIIWESNLAING